MKIKIKYLSLFFLQLYLFSCSEKINIPKNEIVIGDSMIKSKKILTITAKKTNCMYNEYNYNNNLIVQQIFDIKKTPIITVICENEKVQTISSSLLFLCGNNVQQEKLDNIKSKMRKGNKNLRYLGNNFYLSSKYNVQSYCVFFFFKKEDTTKTLSIQSKSKSIIIQSISQIKKSINGAVIHYL